MYLYNSATHKKEEFKTHTPGHVEMYTCGPRPHRQPAQLYHGGRAGEVPPLGGL